ncbi:ATP-binding protein [Halosolutus amylolyticus]|uniref:ATP-binding protein n=1 Tax=Halosolutus amylolyticus TaxID=2932267 RepID=A0ABD5PIN1_9EURY|nr:ATP-binding protein [Halosolutus amylolyticus]
MLNLTPILKRDQPTSRIEIGAKKVGLETDAVEIRHNDRRAFFYVEPVDDSIVDGIGNKVRMHRNVKTVFGGIDRGKDFLVDPGASKHDVVECSAAKIHTSEVTPKELEPFLRENDYLLHPMEEVVPKGDERATFEVAAMEPTGYTTLRVTPDTEIEFIGAGELRELRATRDAASRGGPGPAGEAAGDEVGVQVSLEPKKPTVSFEDDVAGLPEVKRTAENLLALFDPDVRDEVVDRYGDEFASRGNSMLLYGPPGCGKTLISEAIAYEAKFNSSIEDAYGEVKFLEIKGSDVLSKYSGESEKRVEAIFEKAHGIAQEGFAVLFFDEVDTLIPDRGDDSLQRHERSLTNAFLQEMNEIEDNLLVIGATNMPFTIDPAATRRFPIQQFIPQPDEDVMAEVWRKHLSAMDTEGIDYERLGRASKGYTPAEIADRVLGSELQRELVESVHLPDREPIEPDTDYFFDRLNETEPKTIRQYVASVRTQIDDLEGYPELKRYVEAQADQLDMHIRTEPSSLGQLFGTGTEPPEQAANEPTAGAAEPKPGPTEGNEPGSDMAEIDISDPDSVDEGIDSNGGEDDE